MSTVRTLLNALFITVVLVGCITSRPPDAVDFRRIESLKDLEGTYQNLGEGGPGARPVYLSAVIWPNAGLDHKAILAIEVAVSGRDALTVRARRKEGVEKEAVFVEGQDFQLDSGRIRLKNSAGIAGFKSGEPLVGLYSESVELGLDQRGHGRYKQQFSTAGLVYLFLPLAMSGTEEVRFVKVTK